MIHTQLTIHTDYPGIAHYLAKVRLRDTEDESWDKELSYATNDLESMIDKLEHALTCVLSTEDPKDTEKVSELIVGRLEE